MIIMELEGRIALITGASSGIGEVIARFYLKKALMYMAAAWRRKQIFSTSVLPIIMPNICDETQAAQVAAACKEHFGGMDILVNCAGVTA